MLVESGKRQHPLNFVPLSFKWEYSRLRLSSCGELGTTLFFQLTKLRISFHICSGKNSRCIKSFLKVKNFNETHKENCVLLNSVQEFIEIEAWLFLIFSVCSHNKLISICLKNVIHKIGRNKWLLLSAFQQGLLQNWSWFLP